MKKKTELVMGVLLLVAVAVLSRQSAIYVEGEKSTAKWNVVIDVGHGGSDPGKVSADDIEEKDINLEIAKELKRQLRREGLRVTLTRSRDVGMSMSERCEIINEKNADIVVSIHQNSFSDSGVKGAQVFYHQNSNEGKQLAEYLQESLVRNVDEENTRKAKANNTYYLLRHVNAPTVIIECGFLSNPSECALLTDEKYQRKIVYAIKKGLLRYIHNVV